VRTDGDLSSLKPGDVVEARVTGVNIGGLELNIRGVRAFMPKSQVDLMRVEDFTPYIGRRLDCEVSEIDRKGKTVVLSRRRFLERQREQAREELASQLAEGQVRKGVVRRLTDFGAFVDIGGIEGLLHVSDIRWGRVGKPSDVLKVGDELDVQVLKLDFEKKRISLGAKQLQADPWELAAANYRPGAQVNGNVVRLAEFGAFVELEPGVEALLPISEISWTHRIRHPKDVLNEGDAVRVVVIAADPEKRKLTLSLKQLAGDPWKDIEQRYAVDTIVSGRVSRAADFGAFVELEEGVEGLVHISELSDRRVKTVGEVVKPGDVVKVRVKSVDTEQRRISLSMKSAVEPSSAEDHRDAAPAAHAPSRPKRKKQLRGGLD
jgi:small subunit ribosomal protein S1